MTNPESYIPTQMEAQSPLDEADPLEYDTPGLTIGQLDDEEENKSFLAMLNRSHAALE